MFAVPGWSLNSSQLKSQTAELVHTNSSSKKSRAKSSKKRKHDDYNASTKAVNVANLADFWEKIIEKNPGEKIKSRTKTIDQKLGSREYETTKSLRTRPCSGSNDHQSQKYTSSLKNVAKRPSIMENSCVIDSPVISLEKVDSKGTSIVKKRAKNKGKKSTQNDLEVNSSEQVMSNKINTDPALCSKPDDISSSKSTPKLTPLQAAMRQKLVSSRFRYLNQNLYSEPSSHSLALFEENPEMFTEYHEGYRRQVEVWPENPVNSYLTELKTRSEVKETRLGELDNKNVILPLPRTSGICTIADLGCGDAALSTSLQPYLKKLHLRIHSFDLQSVTNLVTKADIANLPLPDASIDVAIFCLALMGTNWIDFIEEAFRVLRWKGELWVAEIKSRFGRVSKGRINVEKSMGNRKRSSSEYKKDIKRIEEQLNDDIAAVEVDGIDSKLGETDVSAFVDILGKRGFLLRSKGGEAIDLKNKMFVKMYFIKGSSPIRGKCVPKPELNLGVGSNSWKKKSKGKPTDQDEPRGQIYCDEAKVLKPCVYKQR